MLCVDAIAIARSTFWSNYRGLQSARRRRCSLSHHCQPEAAGHLISSGRSGDSLDRDYLRLSAAAPAASLAGFAAPLPPLGGMAGILSGTSRSVRALIFVSLEAHVCVLGSAQSPPSQSASRQLVLLQYVLPGTIVACPVDIFLRGRTTGSEQ